MAPQLLLAVTGMVITRLLYFLHAFANLGRSLQLRRVFLQKLHVVAEHVVRQQVIQCKLLRLLHYLLRGPVVSPCPGKLFHQVRQVAAERHVMLHGDEPRVEVFVVLRILLQHQAGPSQKVRKAVRSHSAIHVDLVLVLEEFKEGDMAGLGPIYVHLVTEEEEICERSVEQVWVTP